MMQSSITVRLDPMDKKRFEIFCNGTGLTISNAINMFIKKVINEKRIPFSIEYDDVPNEDTLLAMEEAENMLEHPETIKTYSNFGEMLAEVENEIRTGQNRQI